MAKSEKRASDQRVTAGDRSSRAQARQPATVADRDIARLAFERYCLRGGQHGHDVDDWLQAERELRGVSRSATE